jgi:hypothetical protein
VELGTWQVLWLYSLLTDQSLNVLLGHPLRADFLERERLSELEVGILEHRKNALLLAYLSYMGYRVFLFRCMSKDDLIMSKDGVILAHLVTCLVCK